MLDFNSIARHPQDPSFLVIDNPAQLGGNRSWRQHGIRGAFYDISKHRNFSIEPLQKDAVDFALYCLKELATKAAKPDARGATLRMREKDDAFNLDSIISLGQTHSDAYSFTLNADDSLRRLTADAPRSLQQLFSFIMQYRKLLKQIFNDTSFRFRINTQYPEDFHIHDGSRTITTTMSLNQEGTEIKAPDGTPYKVPVGVLASLDWDVYHRATQIPFIELEQSPRVTLVF